MTTSQQCVRRVLSAAWAAALLSAGTGYGQAAGDGAPPPAPVSAADVAVNRHVLGEYGPYKTPAEAKATLAKALQALVAQGGGQLVIPNDAPAGFYPRNAVQEKFQSPAVTVLDCRNGMTRLYVPPLGTIHSEGTGGGSLIVERDGAVNFPWQGCYSTQHIVSRFPGGASSYMNTLAQDATAGTDARLFVESLRGLFVGQALRVTGEPQGYGGDGEWLQVKALGLEGPDPYLVADAKYNHPKGAIVYNKNVVNGLSVTDVANCDNQSMSLMVDKSIYGVGDTFVVSASLKYQGNVMSGAGDEGGLCYAADIVQDPTVFWGEVETWNPQTRELVYKPPAYCPQKLGTSRAIVNMNPKKWVTAGKVVVVPPGYKYLREAETNLNPPLLVSSGEVGWDASIVGRFIAINDPTEFYAADEALSGGYAGAPGKPLHRWWLITALDKRPDGRWNLYVERTFWWTTRRSGPTLMRFANYSTGAGQVRELPYIIAPGAWASDVRRGVCGNTPGNVGAANPGEPRCIVLAPFPQLGSALDFAPGDPVTQPLGPDVWLPSGVRVRHHQGYPGTMKGASYDTYNAGKVQVGAALAVGGPVDTLENIKKAQKDQLPTYGAAVMVMAATDCAVVVRGPVEGAALDLWQYDGNAKPFRWRLPKGVATLAVNSDTADFTFAGGNLALSGKGTVRQAGISGTAVPARNLRGINRPVPAGATTVSVDFAAGESDAAYAVMTECSWITQKAVREKRPGGFTLDFDKPAPAGGGRLDWVLVR